MPKPSHKSESSCIYGLGVFNFATFNDFSIQYWSCSDSVLILHIYVINKLRLQLHLAKLGVDVWYLTLLSAISCRSVLLVEEIGENHRPIPFHWQTSSHNVLSSTWTGFELITLVVIGADYTGSNKSNTFTITTTPTHLKKQYVNQHTETILEKKKNHKIFHQNHQCLDPVSVIPNFYIFCVFYSLHFMCRRISNL